MFMQAILRAVELLIKLRWFVLEGYYIRIGVQARYLYRQSQLFKDRWQQIDLDFAETSFDNDLGGIGQHFFWKAQNSPWPIKKRIIQDWLLGRPPKPYAMTGGSTS